MYVYCSLFSIIYYAIHMVAVLETDPFFKKSKVWTLGLFMVKSRNNGFTLCVFFHYVRMAILTILYLVIHIHSVGPSDTGHDDGVMIMPKRNHSSILTWKSLGHVSVGREGFCILKVKWTPLSTHLSNTVIKNSLWPGDATLRYRSGLTSSLVIACWLTAPSHYLNPCWLFISDVMMHQPERNFTASI